MSENTNDYLDDDEDRPNTITLKRSEIRSLEKKAKERDELASRLAALENQQTFIEAGIDPKNAQHGYFMKGYDGEMTVDAIKAKATEAGFLSAPAPSQEQTQNLEAAQRVATAASGARPESAPTEESIRAEMNAALMEGGTEGLLAVARKYGVSTVDDYT